MLRLLSALAVLLFAAPVLAQSNCQLDAQGQLYCLNDVSPNMLEATCATTADWHYCLPYHQRACQTGFALACRMAQLGQNCQGGDPGLCQYYLSIQRANRDCGVQGNQQACAWLQAQNL